MKKCIGQLSWLIHFTCSSIGIKKYVDILREKEYNKKRFVNAVRHEINERKFVMIQTIKNIKSIYLAILITILISCTVCIKRVFPFEMISVFWLIGFFLYTYSAIVYVRAYENIKNKIMKKSKPLGFLILNSVYWSLGIYLIYRNLPYYRLKGWRLYLIFVILAFLFQLGKEKGWFVSEKKKVRGYIGLGIVMVLLNDAMYYFPANNNRPSRLYGYGFILIAGIITFLSLLRYKRWEEYKKSHPVKSSWIMFFAGLLLVFATFETLSGNNVLLIMPWHWFMNVIWFFLVAGLVFLFCRRKKISLIITLILMSILGLANGYIVLFRGCPILPADLYLISTAKEVSQNYSYVFSYYMYMGAAFFFVTLSFILRIQNVKPEKREFKRFAIVYLICAVLAVPVFYGNAMLLKGNIDLWRPVKTYRKYGTLNGFGINLTAMQVKKPEGYDVNTVEEVLKGYESDEVRTEKMPNIITVMCEAFSDLSVVGDFTTNEEVMPYFNSLQDNIIKGYAYSSVVGGTTANSEYEFQTGNATTFLPTGTVPYQQYIQGESYSFTRNLKSLDYSATALHAYRRNTYRRELVYPMLGFDQYFAKEVFENPTYLRSYIDDQSDFEKVIEMYEKRDRSNPYYMFNVTMQNHSAYNTYDMEYNIDLTDVSGYDDAKEYLSCVNHTDQAIKTLIEYFSQQEEPTYIIFFGDHQPNLDSGFFTHLQGADMEELSIEELQKRYMVPFFIWSNQEMESKTVDRISLNYLSSFFLREAGLPMTAYNKYLMDLYEKYPVINVNGYIDKDGNHYSASEMKDNPDLVDYNKIVYNAIIDKYENLDWAYQLKGGEVTLKK